MNDWSASVAYLRLERTEMRMLRWILGPWGQEQKWWHPSHPQSSMHHGQGMGSQAEMVWACTASRRAGLYQANFWRQTFVDNRTGETEKGGSTSSSTTWRTCGSTWRTWRIEPTGEGDPVWLVPYLRDPQSEGERGRERERGLLPLGLTQWRPTDWHTYYNVLATKT